MRQADERHNEGSQDLGFPVAATLTAASTIGASVLPAVLGGGGKTPAEKRREMLRKRQKVKRQYQIAMRDIQQMKERKSRNMTALEAQDVRRNGARATQKLWLAEWRNRLSGLPNGETIAQDIADQAQQKTLEVASWKVFKAGLPKLILIGTGVATAAGFGYKKYTESQESQDGT